MKRLWLPVVALGLLLGTLGIVVVAFLMQLPGAEQAVSTPDATTVSEAAATTISPTPLPHATTTPATTTVLSTGLHIRSGPSIDYPVTGWLYAGDTVTVFACRDGWAKLETGYVNSFYLSDNCKEKTHATKR